MIIRKLIIACGISSVVGFVENIVYVVDSYSTCVIMVSGNNGFNITLFVFLRLLTDYLVMTFILIRFILNKNNTNRVSIISTVNEEKLEVFADRDHTHSSIFN